MRNFAKRLIADEARGNKAAATKNAADFNACEKLRPNLATLMGNAGFCALLSRALALAQAEVPWLRAVKVNADGSLEDNITHNSTRMNCSRAELCCSPSCWDCWWPSSARI